MSDSDATLARAWLGMTPAVTPPPTRANGHKPRQLTPADDPPPAPQPAIISARDLLTREFPPLRVIVPGVLVEGSWLLAGKGKAGKSLLAYGLAVALAAGGHALGRLAVQPARVLYISLEDGERRAQRRLQDILGTAPAPERLHLATEWPTVTDGGLEVLESFLHRHPDTGLVLIDTLKRIRPVASNDQRLYDSDYDAAAPLTAIAHKHRVCIVIIHHTRKMAAEDVIDEVSGSTGLTAAVDGVMVFRRVRGSQDATLYRVHRDLDDQEIALRWDAHLNNWLLLGDAEYYSMSDERRAVLRLLRQAEAPLGPQELAGMLGHENTVNLRRLLHKMKEAGQVAAPGYGKYALPPTPGHTGHTGHTGENGPENQGNFRPTLVPKCDRPAASGHTGGHTLLPDKPP